MSEVTVPVVLLEKIAQFIELASKENEDLKAQLKTAATKTASVKEVVKEVVKTVEVPVVAEADAKLAAEQLVEHGLLSAEYLATKVAELRNPKALAETLGKVASLYANRVPTLGGGEEKVAETRIVDRLAEARSRFAKKLGI